jgi:hypothetical protein
VWPKKKNVILDVSSADFFDYYLDPVPGPIAGAGLPGLLLALVVIVVGVDVLFFRNRFWERGHSSGSTIRRFFRRSTRSNNHFVTHSICF